MSRAISAEAEYFQYIQCPSNDRQQVIGGLGWGPVERAGQFLLDRLRNMDVDVVICLGSSMIPFLDTEKRFIMWHDSTWCAGLHCRGNNPFLLRPRTVKKIGFLNKDPQTDALSCCIRPLLSVSVLRSRSQRLWRPGSGCQQPTRRRKRLFISPKGIMLNAPRNTSCAT
jgi:hypothetical protein